MFKTLCLLSALVGMVGLANAQPTTAGSMGGSSLPSCSGPTPQTWDNCIGTFAYPNGNTYTGEYHRGMRQGKGKIRIVAKGPSNENNIGSEIPSTYVGDFANNRINGYGVWTTDKGQKFAGYFVNNIYQGPNPPAQQPTPQQQQMPQQSQQRVQSAQQQQMCQNLEKRIKENDPSQNAWLALTNGLDAANAQAGNYGNGGVAMANQNKIQQQQLLMQLTDQYMRYCQQ